MQIQKKDKRGNPSYNYNDESSQSPLAGRMAGGQRSPLRLEKDTGESGYGEMLYLDPNDVNFRRNQAMSPITEGRQSTIQGRSPTNRFGQSVLAAVRSDLNERNDTAQVMGSRPLPNLNVTVENKRRERLERSPKTINIGDTEKDLEYNIRTLNPRRSPKNMNQINNTMYQTSTNYNEPGNIFLDQPMQSGSFLQGQGETSTYQASPMAGMSMLQAKPSNDYLNGNSREIQYSMNPRDLQEPLPNLMNKMSPNKNVDDESTSDNKGNDTATQLKDLKSQMDRNANLVRNEGDGMIEQPSRQIRNDMEKMEGYAKTREIRDTITEGEMKKLVRQMTKGYDPRKGNEGRLISTSQTIIPGANEEIFNDRYKVLQKMNKLSTILLAKNRNSVVNPDPLLNRSIDEQRKTFDRNTLNSTVPGKTRRQTLSRSPQNKFLYLSLAMISSKGPNCEDRIILRKMRFDKGGVVDLAQEAQKKKDKFKVKKIQRKSIAGGARGMFNYNPKYREKAAKVVQAWWRDLKGRYQKILDKIILIQSVWRGRWLRKYIYDIIYLSFLHQRFCDILEKVMVSHVRPIVWEELFGDKKWAKECLAKLLIDKDKRFTYLRLKPFFERWKNTAQFLARRNLKSKKLINRKELDEKNKKLLAKYLDEWALRANLLKYIGKTKDAEAQKKKFFGMLSLISGTNQLAKRGALYQADPRIRSYLAKRIRSNALKSLVLHAPKFELLAKRKYFNKWINQLMKMKMKDFKRSIFGKMLGHLDSRINRLKQKDCFNLWRSKLPKDLFLSFQKGSELLQKFTWRRTHKDPLKALKEKCRYNNERDGILRMLGVKNRYIRYHWREYLYKWRSQAQKIKDKEMQDRLYKSLLNTMLKKMKYRILSNRFAQWKKKPDLDLDALFDRYKAMNNMIRRTWNCIIRPDKEKFLKGVKNTVHPKSYKLAVLKLLEQYVNKDRTMLRYFLYKWRDQCKNFEIFDLKVQLIKYLCGANESRNYRNKLARSLGKWRLAANTGKLNEHSEKMRCITSAFDKLNKMYLNKKLDLWVRLFRLMNKDYRPKYIEAVAYRLMKPRNTVRDCFNKWRQINNKYNVRDLKGKMLKSGAKRVNERQNRDAMLRGFFKWLNMCRNPEDYYPKITNGLNKLLHAIKNNQCRNPFDALKLSKNYARRLIPLLKNNKHLQDRLNRELMKDRFNRWMDKVNKGNVKDLKTNIIFRTRNNLMSNKKGQLLSRFFTRWKVYRPKTLNADFYKALMLVQNFCEKPYRKDVINAFKNKVNGILKKQGLFALFGTSKTFLKKLLHNNLMKWWKNAVLTDPNKFAKIKARLRRLVKDKEEQPLSKGFHRWIRALAKNPEFTKIINASDKLKSIMVRNNKPAYDKIKGHVSLDYIRRKICKNVLPNSKLSKERAIRNIFDRWKMTTKNMGIRDLKASLISKLYGNTKGALRERFMRKYFKRWSYKEPEKKPIDLFGVLQSMDILHKMLSKKYMPGFFPNMKEYGKQKFLRSLLLGTSKYHKRRMKPYLDRWRTTASKLNTKLLLQDASSRFMARTKGYRTSYKMQNLLRGKYNQWKRVVNKLRDKANKEIPQGVEHLNKHNTKINGPEFIDLLRKLAFKNHKQSLLRSLPPKREKCDNRNMKKLLDRWKSQVTKMILNDMNNRLKYNQLRHLVRLFEVGPLKYFLLWRFKAGVKRSTSPIVQGIDKLRRILISDMEDKFLRRANMMNLKIPRGISTQTALIRRQRNIAKSIALRNIAMRPFWNRYKEKTVALRNKAHRHQLFNKIIGPTLRNMDKLMLRRGYNTWKDNVNALIAQEKLKLLQMKLMHLLYDRNTKYYLKKYMNLWLKNCGLARDKLKLTEEAMKKLRHFANREVTNKFRELLLHQSKFSRVKAMLINALRNNDKDNLAYCFNKWKLITQKMRELFLKTILLRNLTSKQDYKNEEFRRNRMHEVLLHWRIKSAPKDYLERMRRIREGSKLLKAGVRKPHLRDIFDGIRKRANDRFLNYLLYKIINAIGPKSDLLNKRRAFNTWKDRLGDTDLMRRKMMELLNKYLMSDPIHEKMIHEPEQDIVGSMNAYDKKKRNDAKTIGDFTRGLLNIKRQFGILKRNKILRKKVLSINLALFDKYKILTSKWLRNAKFLKSNENAIIIQRFLKSRLNNPSDKRKRIVRGGEILSTYVKRVVFGKIFETAKDNLMKKVLRRHIEDQEKLNKKMLTDAFNRWRDLMPIMRMNDSATMIENNYRNLRSRRKLNDLRRRKAMLEYLTMKLIGKYGDIKGIAFHQWNNIAQALKCNSNAKIIQKFVDEKLRELLKAKAQLALYAQFRKYTIKELCKYMAKASRIIGDRGEVMYRTLEDIYVRRPFNKLMDGLKWIGREKTLKKLMPRIQEALRKYWVPFYAKRWKQNTWDDMINKLIQLQTWIRQKMAYLRVKRQLRREDLLHKYLLKLANDKELKLKIPFKIWDKKAKVIGLTNSANSIQKMFRGLQGRKQGRKLLAQKKLNDLFTRNIFQQVNDAMNDANRFTAPLRKALNKLNGKAETHYTTDNLIDFANDGLRNAYLLRLTGKLAYTDAMSALRRYFDRWQQYNRHANESATRIQTNFRAMKGRMKRKLLARLEDILRRLFLKHCGNDKLILGSGFREWLKRARYIKCDDMGKIIQKFLRPRLAKLLNDKFKAFFNAASLKMVHRRLNDGAKVNKLNKALMKPNVNYFLSALRNKDKYDRLRLIFAKNFAHLDDQFLRLLMETYLQRWRDNTNKLNKQRNDAATTLENGYRTFRAKKRLNDLRAKRDRLMRMLLKMISDREFQKQVAFNLWRSNANSMRLNDSSKIIQNFMNEVKEKLRQRQLQRKRRNMEKGLNKLMNMKFFLREPLDKIISESNRVIFTKFNDDLAKKRKDHLKDAYDAIREEEKRYLLNRLFGIPDSLKHKILRKAINKWKDNADRMGKRHAAERIQKNYRLYHQRKVKNMIEDLIKDRLAKIAMKNGDIVRYYFNVWSKNAKHMKILRAGKKINNFLEKKLKDARAHQKWKKMSEDLNILNGNYQALNLLKRMRQFMAIYRFAKPIEHAIKEDTFEDLKEMYRLAKLNDFLRLLFGNFDKRNEILNMKRRLRMWRDKALKMRDREEALDNAMNVIDTRRKIIGADTINSACLIKKLFNTIPKVRALDFFDRLRRNAEAKKQLEAFAESLKQARNELVDTTKSDLTQRVYKLFIYRKLGKMFGGLNNYLLYKIKPQAGKEFLQALYDNLKRNSYFNYDGEKASSFKCPATSLKFHKRVTNPKNIPLQSDNSGPMKKLLPFFVDYLDSKVKGTKRWVVDKLIDNDKYGRFCSLYKKFSTKVKIPQKEDLVSELKARSNYMDTQGQYLIRLFKLLRKRWVKHVTTSLVEPNKIYKLLYLLRITYMHKKVAKQRFIRELTRKWRFAAFVKKMARKKLELMYKSMHVSYLQMANEVFGEEEDNPSVMKEFERFTNNIGMFSGEEPLNDELSKKYVKTVQKKYVFKNNVIDDEHSDIKKYTKHNEDIKEIEEDNQDFYVDQDSETTGKFKK